MNFSVDAFQNQIVVSKSINLKIAESEGSNHPESCHPERSAAESKDLRLPCFFRCT
jgi:hypothetical protein